jgi:hypothetical protein
LLEAKAVARGREARRTAASGETIMRDEGGE